jgi:serine phosphatase RsbU (regulator of sigma subunit)
VVVGVAVVGRNACPHTEPMVSRALDSVGRIRQRGPLPALSFNLVAGLGATVAAAAGCVIALSLGRLPGPSSSIILLTLAPACGLLALPVLSARGRAESDLPVEWVAGGLAVTCLALVLQLISFPSVSSSQGPLHTGGQGSAQLYLTFHVWLYGSALAGALRVPRRWIRRAWRVGTGLCVLEAVNGVPSPGLLTPQENYTGPLVVVEWVIVLLGLVALAWWTRSAGRLPTPLRGWIGVSVLLSCYELAFNALAGRRYDELWWASLSMRATGFAVLALGGLGYLLRQSRRVEQFSEAELALRDTELRGSVAVTDRLLLHARELARSYTPEQVAATLCATVQALTGACRVTVAHRQDQGELVRIAAVGTEPGGTEPGDTQPGDTQPGDTQCGDTQPVGTGGTAADTGATAGNARRSPLPIGPTYLTSRQEIERQLAPRDRPGPAVRAMAIVPLDLGTVMIGTLTVEEPAPRVWSAAERELLEGLADQAAPVLSRARLAAREHRAAETLQRSLLPPRLPDVPGITVAARYQPASREEQVGGDWYDGWALPDGRLALVIGDVVGKGLAAAAATGRLRASVRALAAADPSPGQVLTQLDRLESEEGGDMVATVLYALFEADLRAVRIARAGHPPAVVAHPDRSPRLIEHEVGTPIGLGVQPTPETLVELQSGSTLVLYTDGLVEDRTRPLQDRLGDLLAAVRAQLQPGEPDRLATYLMTRFRSSYEDDVALLVACCDGA